VRWADIPGTASAFYRVLIAGAVLIPWWFATTKGDSPLFSQKKRTAYSRRAALVAIAGGVFFALDLALWNTAVLRTQAAVASILGNNTPIFVGILSWVLFRRRPRAAFWIGLSLSLAGCLTIMGERVLGAGATAGSLTGNLMALGASVFFAAYLAATERVRRTMDTLTFNTLAIAGSIASLFVFCLVLGLPLTGYSTRTWLALAGLGLVSQLMAYYALVYALGHLPATVTSVGLLAQVPGTSALAWLLLGEPLTPMQIVGGVVVLAGIFVVVREG
jgi:drug/metabolite transporter (DMT)-like permease